MKRYPGFPTPPPAPTCPMCGVREVRTAKRHCRICAALQRIWTHKLPHTGNMMLVALVAEAAQIPRKEVAIRLDVSPAVVTEWITPRMRLVKRLRRRLQHMSPLRALASVLRVSLTAAREYVYGRGYRRRRPARDKSQRGPTTAIHRPRFLWRHTHLPALLDMKPGDFFLGFDLKGMYADELEQRGRSGLMARARWGRRRSACAIVQAAVRLLVRGRTYKQVTDYLADLPDSATTPTEGVSDAYVPERLRRTLAQERARSYDWKELRRMIEDHGHKKSHCRCRPFTAVFLSAYYGMNERAVAERLGISPERAHDAIRRGRRLVGVVASGLRVGDVAARVGVSRSTVRRRAADATRTPGGHRRFTVRDVSRLTPRQAKPLR